MRIKASNMSYWADRHSGLFPLDALPAIDKHLTYAGDTVWVSGITYELV